MMIKPSRFFSWRFSIRLINGYMTAWNGTSMAAVNIKSRTLEKRVWFLTIIQAEREETTTKRATEVRVTRAVIAKLPKLNLFRRAGQMAEIPRGRQRQRRADDLRLGLKGVDQQEGQGERV